ncbi:FimV/HubP family polar landmark protein [uncultured Psychrobacter sp.]|uniref:FimV/HubP family polar landmark protein n=1 Tax=uncultured Psychrobacter sp. TaxID=259303 RepID=UPI0025924528|nr:FimV/HubP family polar landmark protein [uncultured Psychrobacter sp.]
MSLKIIIALVLIILIAALFFVVFRKENTARKSPSLPASNNPNSNLNTNLTQPQRHDNLVGSVNMEENQSIEDAETIEKNIETLDPIDTHHRSELSVQPLLDDDELQEILEMLDETGSETEERLTQTAQDNSMPPFEFIEPLNSVQLTLDLAQHYLDTGKYDSAKRLAQEVIEGDGSDEQKAFAQSILDRLP